LDAKRVWNRSVATFGTARYNPCNTRADVEGHPEYQEKHHKTPMFSFLPLHDSQSCPFSTWPEPSKSKADAELGNFLDGRLLLWLL
jgi:hypothetical protein